MLPAGMQCQPWLVMQQLHGCRCATQLRLHCVTGTRPKPALTVLSTASQRQKSTPRRELPASMDASVMAYTRLSAQPCHPLSARSSSCEAWQHSQLVHDALCISAQALPSHKGESCSEAGLTIVVLLLHRLSRCLAATHGLHITKSL